MVMGGNFLCFVIAKGLEFVLGEKKLFRSQKDGEIGVVK